VVADDDREKRFTVSFKADVICVCADGYVVFTTRPQPTIFFGGG